MSKKYFIKVKIITNMNYTLIPFSSSIFLSNRNIKIKSFKDFKKLKPHRNLNIFHETSI